MGAPRISAKRRRTSNASSSRHLASVCQRSKTTARVTGSSCPPKVPRTRFRTKRVLRGFGLACVEAQLEQPPEPFARLGRLEAKIQLWSRPRREHSDRVVGPAPAVAAQVALVLGERPQALHDPHRRPGAGWHG